MRLLWSVFPLRQLCLALLGLIEETKLLNRRRLFDLDLALVVFRSCLCGKYFFVCGVCLGVIEGTLPKKQRLILYGTIGRKGKQNQNQIQFSILQTRAPSATILTDRRCVLTSLFLKSSVENQNASNRTEKTKPNYRISPLKPKVRVPKITHHSLF